MHALRARGLGALAIVLGLAARAGAADLVVFHAPPEAGAEIAGARDAIARTAAAAGAAFLDLSPAPPPTPAAPALLARGVERFEALRLDEAQAALDDALAEARVTGAAGLGTTQISDLFLFRGLVRTQRGETAGAWDELVHAATIEPTRHLDAARFPPKVVQAFQRAVASVAGGTFGRLAVDAPGPCRAFVDGRPSDVAPEVPLGEHFVRRECPGEPPAGAVVVVSRETTTATLPRNSTQPPADAALATLARERGAARLLAAVVHSSALGPATVRLRLLDGKTGAELSAATAAAGDPASVRAASERLLAPHDVARAPALPAAPPPRPRRWYTSPWLWGAVGAVVGAAVVLPFAIDSQRPSVFGVRPSGLP